MRVARGLSSISQVTKSKRFAELAGGLPLLAESVRERSADADQLADARRFQSAAVLRSFAEEEAAKVLILLDLARCGWDNDDRVKVGLSAFYNHLARGLYVQAYWTSPADLAEVKEIVDFGRQELYLDGPTGADWIIRNDVMGNRESALYVDYIETGDGKRQWTGPAERAARFDEPFDYALPACKAVSLVGAMDRVGLLTEAGLYATRDAWGDTPVDDHKMRYTKLVPINEAVIRNLERRGGLASDCSPEDVRYVVKNWIFPLIGLDLSLREVKVSELRKEQERVRAALAD
uniref:Uncharacterized protein n=1 Tax=Rhodococcus hoagii TaxID=43767 RepID=A0A1Z1UXG2_RHOHA|nr:hypothetical protein pVAPN1572_1404 [Prescottella equi]